MAKQKSMSDGEVNDFVFKKLMGDLDEIEADGMFNESASEAKLEGGGGGAMGVTIEIKPVMAGEQTKQAPKVETKEEDEEEAELGD
jgi:hypothetical protein